METTPSANRGPQPDGPANGAGPGASLQEQHVIAKVSRHLLWFLFILFFFSFLDRINIGFAGLTMMKDLGLSGTQFGLATTLFYIAYIAFGIPSNIVLARIGARKWIGTIMIAWGLASTATMFASSPNTLYLLRVLVGVTEAGFLPGILLYMTYWFPSAYRARANAMFMIAMPVTAAVGSALSGYILALDGTLGLRGWQWLFFLEGLPSAILGLVVFAYLHDGPAKATWLSADEKRTLSQTLAAEHRADPRTAHIGNRKKKPSQRTRLTDRDQVCARLFLSRQYARDGCSLDPADREELQRRRKQPHHRSAGCDPANLHDRRDDLVGKAFRSQAGTQMAPDAAHAVFRCWLALHGLLGKPRRPDAGDLPGVSRIVHRHVDLLDDARSRAELPSPRGRHRRDQCHGQYRLGPQSTGGGMAKRPDA